MNRTIAATAILLLGATALVGGVLAPRQAGAWGSANRYGGSTSHTWGETSHQNAFGGSTTHVAGEGTEHTNAYGGSTAHAYGGGTEHTNMYGGHTYGEAGYGAVHTGAYGATAYRPPAYGAYPAYHPPVAVPYYSQGCYGCAAAAGAVAGVAVGAAAASASSGAAYSSGYAAGAASAPPPAYPVGMNVVALPAGAQPVQRGGATLYVAGNAWFQPVFGANGVYYRVVPAP